MGRATDLSTQNKPRDIWRHRAYEMVLFSMLGALMFCSKIIMEFLPNIHLLGMLTILYTAVFRAKALIPIYINVFLIGLYGGFSFWWFGHLYIWTVLWALTMLFPKKMPDKIGYIAYPILCTLHGISYGTLYAPAWALATGMDLEAMLAWIAAGFSFDIIHALGNLAVGFLIMPAIKLLRRMIKTSHV